jgi:hypothetical protein
MMLTSSRILTTSLRPVAHDRVALARVPGGGDGEREAVHARGGRLAREGPRYILRSAVMIVRFAATPFGVRPVASMAASPCRSRRMQAVIGGRGEEPARILRDHE